MTDDDGSANILLELNPGEIADPHRSVLVMRYLEGQFRIHICDNRAADGWRRHGGIIADL